jgi:hypothetical protein
MGLGYFHSRVFAIFNFLFCFPFSFLALSYFPLFKSNFFCLFFFLLVLSPFSILGYLKEAYDIPPTAVNCC